MSETLHEYIDKHLVEAASGLQAFIYVLPKNTGRLNFEKALHRIYDCRSVLANVTDIEIATQYLRLTSKDLSLLLSGPAELSVTEAIRIIDETIGTITAKAWSI